MAEYSFPWTDGVGDGGPYAADFYDTFEHYFVALGQPNRGVVWGLRVSGTASPLLVTAGAAVVNGKRYIATTSVSVSVPTPTGATRVDRIVVQLDWSTRTGRVVRLAGTEGSGTPPALTQTDGVKWEIPLAKATVTTGGAITVVDERDLVRPANPLPLGSVIMWSGTLSGHYPVDPRTGVADNRWHICNGDVENGVQTPDLRDRFVVAAGGTYSQGSTGGQATVNLSHTHGVGTLAAASAGDHAHGVGTLAAGSESEHTHGPGTLTTNSVQAGLHNHTISNDGAHNHDLYKQASLGTAGADWAWLINAFTAESGAHTHGGLTGSTNPTAHAHTVMSGATGAGSAHSHGLSGSTASTGAHSHTLAGSTDSKLSATQSVLPPYYALTFLCFVGD